LAGLSASKTTKTVANAGSKNATKKRILKNAKKCKKFVDKVFFIL
jgi:hypothetical protein